MKLDNIFNFTKNFANIFFVNNFQFYDVCDCAFLRALWAQPIMTIFLPPPPSECRTETFFPFVNFRYCELSSLSQQRCFPTYKPVMEWGRVRERLGTGKIQIFIYDFCQQIYVFHPFSFAAKWGWADPAVPRGMRNEQSFSSTNITKSPSLHTTPGLILIWVSYQCQL